MHKNLSLPQSLMSTDHDLCGPVHQSFDNSLDERQRPEDGTVLALPPGRDGITADIRMINRQCFLMLCDTHCGLLSSLASVPTKLVLAARNLIKSDAIESHAELWTATLSHYTQSLVDARSQIMAAAKLHGLGDRGRAASSAIETIETTLPLFLRAASHPSSSQEELRKSAERLGKSSMALTESLSVLLQAVESATERARNLERSEGP